MKRSQVAMCAGLAFLFGAQPSLVAAQEACSVRFEGSSVIRYSEHNLEAVIHRGFYGDQAFSLIDDDGFLTLAILYSTWQSEGVAQRNRTEPVAVRSSDILLAQRVGRFGIAYQSTLLDLLRATPQGERAEDHEENIAKAEDRLAAWASLAGRLEGLVNQPDFSASGTVELPTGFLRARMADPMLRRLHVDAPGRWLSVYGDSRRGTGRHVLCDPEATSIMIGRVLCAYDFGTDLWMNVLDCPRGLRFEPVSRVRFCREQQTAPGPNGEVRVERVNCTNGVGGPATS